HTRCLSDWSSDVCSSDLVGMQPYEGNAVLELNPSLIFPIIEILLGGNGKPGTAANREITEIEQNVLDGLFHNILQALSESWKDEIGRASCRERAELRVGD